jgi:hypothetical protein
MSGNKKDDMKKIFKIIAIIMIYLSGVIFAYHQERGRIIKKYKIYTKGDRTINFVTIPLSWLDVGITQLMIWKQLPDTTTAKW